MLELHWGMSALLTRWWFWLVVVIAVAGAGILALASAGFGGPDDPIDRMRRNEDVPGLVRVIEQAPNEAEAVRAVRALHQIGGEKVEAPLKKAADDERPPVREQAVMSLAKVTRRKHVDKLVAVMRRDEDPTVRAAAATALGQVWACDEVPDLIDAMNDRNPIVQRRALWSVKRICGVEPGYEERDAAKLRRLRSGYYRAYWKYYGPLIKRYHLVHNKR